MKILRELVRMIREILCRHKSTTLVRQLHGDERNHFGARYLYVCRDCGDHIYKDQL
jgi:hypothetical protein